VPRPKKRARPKARNDEQQPPRRYYDESKNLLKIKFKCPAITHKGDFWKSINVPNAQDGRERAHETLVRWWKWQVMVCGVIEREQASVEDPLELHRCHHEEKAVCVLDNEEELQDVIRRLVGAVKIVPSNDT
jgi:hypothetical protein